MQVERFLKVVIRRRRKPRRDALREVRYPVERGIGRGHKPQCWARGAGRLGHVDNPVNNFVREALVTPSYHRIGLMFHFCSPWDLGAFDSLGPALG